MGKTRGLKILNSGGIWTRPVINSVKELRKEPTVNCRRMFPLRFPLLLWANVGTCPVAVLSHRLLLGSESPGQGFATPLLRQVHLAEERLVVGITLKVLVERIEFDLVKPGVLLTVSTIKPRKCLVQA